MVLNRFPPISLADESGLLCMGGNLSSELLEEAYRNGVFPWPCDERNPIPWFSPNPRGILFANDLRINRSLKKELRKTHFEVTFNKSFVEIISMSRIHHLTLNDSTWITNQMVAAYINMFNRGQAFSVEVREDGEITGGLYGISINSLICGESMFYIKPNRSKFAILSLIAYMKLHSIEWMDLQMVTETTQSIGGVHVSRERYQDLLSNAIERKTSIFKDNIKISSVEISRLLNLI